MKTKFLFLLTLILLVGCEPVAEFVYVNVTQYHTTETVREVQVACPTCPSCPAQKACPTPVKCDDELSAKKLTICYAQIVIALVGKLSRKEFGLLSNTI